MTNPTNGEKICLAFKVRKTVICIRTTEKTGLFIMQGKTGRSQNCTGVTKKCSAAGKI